MALGCPSLILLLLACRYASSSYLTPEVAAFIPACAQDCFKSFLANNYGSFPNEVCGGSPSLECLCTSNSTSGYTVGEGAVQCLISEDNIGFCQGVNATQAVVANAYQMCNGVQNSLPETHGTITATLVVQTSSPSIVLLAPPSTTSSSRNSSTFPLPTSSMTILPTASPVRTTSALSTASAQAATNTGAATKTSLTKAQIVGISVGSAGAAAVILGLLICVACWRRRKQRKARERDSDSLPFQIEPPPHLMEKKKKSFYTSRTRNGEAAIQGPGPTPSGVAVKVVSPGLPKQAPPIPIRLDNSDPRIFSRKSLRPETIGMALSPDNKGSKEAQRRRASRLLPEKPTLKLQVPPEQQGNGLSFSQAVPSGAGRQSTATQFEEDIDTADTAVNSEDPWSRSSSDGILNKSPNYGKSPQYAENDPEDLRRHVLAGGKAGFQVDPLNIRMQDRNNFTQQRNAPPMPSQLAAAHLSGGSSAYSDRKSDYSNDGANLANRLSYRQPGPYDKENFEFVVSPQEIEPRQTDDPRAAKDLSPVMESPASGKSPVSYPKIPEAISPTIMRKNYGPPPPQPNFTQANSARVMGLPLSPTQQPLRAAEIRAQQKRDQYARQQAETQARSPPRAVPPRAASANGHARKRFREKVNVLDFPAPPRSRDHSPFTPLPPSLRINTQEGTRSPPPRSQTAPLTDATGGWNYNPYSSSYSQPQPQPQTRHQNSQRKPQRPLPQPQQSQRSNPSQINTNTTASSNTIPAYENPLMSPTWQPQSQPQAQSQPQPQSPRPRQPHIVHNPPHIQPALHRSPSALSNISQASKLSTSSSLLAKRLGESKASKLALRTEEMNEGRKRQQAKWRVLDREQQDRATEGGWRPMLGRGEDLRGRERDQDEGVDFGGDESKEGEKKVGREGEGEEGREEMKVQFANNAGREFERMELPQTPGWVPKLTPTRRGDVLFLNVA